jgi:hypothetical protein
MSWKFRPDETDLFFGSGAPTSTQVKPAKYIDQATGAEYVNLGGNSATWYQVSGGALAGVGNASRLLTAAKTITVADHGCDFYLNALAGFAITLPTAAAALRGLRFRCFVEVATTSVGYTIVTGNSAEQLMAGQVYCSAGTDEDSETAFTGTTLTFDDTAGVIGDWCEIISCGATGWLAYGFCNATGGITITG